MILHLNLKFRYIEQININKLKPSSVSQGCITFSMDALYNMYENMKSKKRNRENKQAKL